MSVNDTVNKELLMKHIYTDETRPDAIPYHYWNGFNREANWGFSLPYNIVKDLPEDNYYVDIYADLDENGSLKVVDLFLPGELEETIFFAAHTCHPAQVSDGIANIAVALELYSHLRKMSNRKYSYRFIFGPEFFGAATYLQKASRKEFQKLKGGFYLDMLSSHEPIGYQQAPTSYQGMRLGNIVRNVLSSHVSMFNEYEYRKFWGNDEIFYNLWGIPTVVIGRGIKNRYREYHTDLDNFDNIDEYHLIESVWILERIVEAMERDFVPSLTYKTPLYLSGFSDRFKLKGEVREKFDRIESLTNDYFHCSSIAAQLGLDLFELIGVFDEMRKNSLVTRGQDD